MGRVSSPVTHRRLTLQTLPTAWVPHAGLAGREAPLFIPSSSVAFLMLRRAVRSEVLLDPARAVGRMLTQARQTAVTLAG